MATAALILAAWITLISGMAWADKPDLNCASKDVMDAGFHVTGSLDADENFNLHIEEINNWQGNKVVYSSRSQIVATTAGRNCEHIIIDEGGTPETVLLLSPHHGPTLEMINGNTPERFSALECVVSEKLVAVMSCAKTL